MKEIKINTLDVQELKKRRDADPDLILIDVRELDEWQALRIPDAWHIPKDDITSIKDKITNMYAPIYLHCKSGVRSLYAAHCLIELGYKEVYSVDGGILEWARMGFSVTSG